MAAALAELLMDISQAIVIESSPEDAYRSLVHRLTDAHGTPDGRPLPMVLEEWPGGRWYRDLGEDHGHLWGFVQVIKPPTLLELHGPMFMSYAVAGHLQFRLTPIEGAVELSMRHRVVGPVEDAHRRGVTHGWGYLLEQVKLRAEN
jgi:hypothetical protein